MNPELRIEWFQNCYRCMRCRKEWENEWSCRCNDRCPDCDIEITPYSSLDISEEVTDDDLIFAQRRLPSPLWIPDVVSLLQERMEGR
jgi:hypothetical protein